MDVALLDDQPGSVPNEGPMSVFRRDFLVGLGGVGSLLYCELAGVPFDRKYDQGPGRGGCWFEFGLNDLSPICRWTPMERQLA
jgi:hypothetical protein